MPVNAVSGAVVAQPRKSKPQKEKVNYQKTNAFKIGGAITGGLATAGVAISAAIKKEDLKAGPFLALGAAIILGTTILGSFFDAIINKTVKNVTISANKKQN